MQSPDEPLDLEHLKQWIGKKESRRDTLAPFAANGLAATLDRGDAPYVSGAAVPAMWHLVYCVPTPPMSGLGPDGHAKRGGLLPPVPLPRRMWAGGRMEFRRPLVIGSEVTRQAEILNVALKTGRTGPMVFVTARFELSDADGVCVTEERDIVYREMPKPDSPVIPPKPAPTDAVWSRTLTPDPVLLFRYSALTFNGHRIHFDREFCIDHEGYPGLVVHGPLIATLLVDLVRRQLPDRTVAAFDFRAVSPLFDTAPFTICGTPETDGKTVRLWAQNAGGGLAMEGIATLA